MPKRFLTTDWVEAKRRRLLAQQAMSTPSPPTPPGQQATLLQQYSCQSSTGSRPTPTPQQLFQSSPWPATPPPTDPGITALKIRCRNPTDGEQLDATGKRKRGVVISKKTEEMVRLLGHKIPVEYSERLDGPSNRKLHGQMTRDIGSCVRGKVPMLGASYSELCTSVPDAGDIVYNTLSVWYSLPPSSGRMFMWIEKQANSRYKQWKSDCQHHYMEHGDAVPFEFLNRPHEWEWLVNHFNTPQQKAKCARLKKIRTESTRPRHHSGPVPFSYRSEVHELNGEPAPIIKTYEEVYKVDPLAAPIVERMNAEVQGILEPLAELRSDTPDDGFVTLTVATQLSILDRVVDQRRGTAISGVGGSIRRSPKKRGGARSSTANEEMLKGKIRNLEEQLADINKSMSNRMQFFQKQLKDLAAASGRPTEQGSPSGSGPEVGQEGDDPSNPGVGNADGNGRAN